MNTPANQPTTFHSSLWSKGHLMGWLFFLTAAAVFVADILTPPECEVWLAYLVILPFTYFIPWPKFPLVAAGVCTALIVFAFDPSSSNHFPIAVEILNICIGIAALWITTALLLARRKALKVLQESEQRYRDLFERNLAGVLVTRADGVILEANDAVARIFGMGSRQEMLGRRMPEFYFDAAEREVLAGAVLRDRSLTTREIRFRRTDGQPVWTLANLSLLHDSPDGQLFHGTLFDITERKRAEETLRLRDRAIQAVTQGIVITDSCQPDNPIVYASPGFEKLTGYRQEEILGKTYRFLERHDTNPDALAKMAEAIRAECICTVELLNRKKDGASFWNHLTVSPVRDDKDRLTHFVWVHEDATERRQLEEWYRQSQKMEAFGQLAGGVAHDFNNLLTVIIGYSDILLSKLHPDDTSHELIREVKKAGERASTLTRQLLAFSRKQVLESKVLGLNAIITDMEKMLQRLIGEDINLVTALEPNLKLIKADPGQLEQVLLNLAVNARDAMP